MFGPRRRAATNGAKRFSDRYLTGLAPRPCRSTGSSAPTKHRIPSIGGAFTIDGVQVLWPKNLAQLLTKISVSHEMKVSDLHSVLTAAFPTA
jgi:hypothetical protein